MRPWSWVVVAYHRPVELERLLTAAALPALGLDAPHVVVVNVEGDPEVAAVADAHGAQVVPLHGNPGYFAAINVGLTEVATDHVVFSNDDIQVGAADLSRLVDGVGLGREVAVPALRSTGGQREPSIAALATPRSLLVEWALLPDRPLPGLSRLTVQKWRQPTRAEPVEAAMAAVVATTTEVLRRWPLPEHYVLYWEEHDWFWRLRAAGLRLWFCPEVAVVHDGGREARPARSAFLARNAVRCVRSTQGRASAALAVPVVVAWNLRLLIQDALRSPFSATVRGHLPARRAGLAAAVRSWREVR